MLNDNFIPRHLNTLNTFVTRPFHNSMSMTGAGTVSRRARIPTPAIKFNFERSTRVISSGKDILPSKLVPGALGNETLKQGTEF